MMSSGIPVTAPHLGWTYHFGSLEISPANRSSGRTVTWSFIWPSAAFSTCPARCCSKMFSEHQVWQKGQSLCCINLVPRKTEGGHCAGVFAAGRAILACRHAPNILTQEKKKGKLTVSAICHFPPLQVTIKPGI